MQALLILFGSVFTVAVTCAAGSLLLRRLAVRLLPGEEAGLAFVVGAPVLSAAVFAACALQVAYPAVFLLIGAAVLGLYFVQGRALPKSLLGQGRELPAALRIPFLLAFGAFFVLYFVNAMAPEASPDGTRYHLALVGRYLAEHGFHRITTSMYASLSQGVEMLYLFAFAFGKHSAAAMVHFAFLPALAWQMYCYGRREGFPVVGASAALLVFASPAVGVDAASAYVDVAVAAIAFTVFYILQIWDAERQPGLAAAAGLVAGFAFAAKYTASLAVPYAVAFVAWKSLRGRDPRAWRNVALVAGVATAVMLPWLAKNWLWLQNPVAPFFNQYFPNPHVTVAFEKEYRQMMMVYELKSRWELPMAVTTTGALSGLLGPVFLLSPLALLALFRRQGRQLLLAALAFGATYFANVGARFLIPPLPFIAFAMALAFSNARGLAVAVALFHAVISWPSIVPRYAAGGVWKLSRRLPTAEALRLRPEEPYLEAHLEYYGVARMLDRVTPPGSRIFTYTGIPEAYTSREVLPFYQSAENIAASDVIWTGFAGDCAPIWRLRFSFPRQSLRGLRVVNTATGSDRWRVHELRVLDGARELPRSPQWRLRASSYPWGVQQAFDNSLVTSWTSGETIHDGMFVEVDFRRNEEADSVLIETAPNQWGIRLKLEGRDASGNWRPLAPAPEQSFAPLPLGLRRAVAGELKRRGIDYLLMFDSDFGADDFRDRADAWGVRRVGVYGKARLYQLP